MTYEQNKLGFVSPAIDEYLLIIRKLIKLRFNFAAWIIEYPRLLKYLTFDKVKKRKKYA